MGSGVSAFGPRPTPARHRAAEGPRGSARRRVPCSKCPRHRLPRTAPCNGRKSPDQSGGPSSVQIPGAEFARSACDILTAATGAIVRAKASCHARFGVVDRRWLGGGTTVTGRTHRRGRGTRSNRPAPLLDQPRKRTARIPPEGAVFSARTTCRSSSGMPGRERLAAEGSPRLPEARPPPPRPHRHLAPRTLSPGRPERGSGGAGRAGGPPSGFLTPPPST